MSESSNKGGIRHGSAVEDGRSLQKAASRKPDDEVDDEELPQYIFKPLTEPDEIRVLNIHPTTGNRIELSIRHVCLYEGGYQALSYMWGSEERPFQAVIRSKNGQVLGSIPLTTNLRNALRDLRETKELGKFFWIDLICINQDDGEEKGRQVALMDQIYMNGERVITYTGPSGPEDLEKKGLELLTAIFIHFAPSLPDIMTAHSMGKARSQISALPVKEIGPDIICKISEREWDWLVEVAFPEWTSRLWIIQEQLLNSETVMLRGSRLLVWVVVASTTILFGIDLLPMDRVTRFWRNSSHRTSIAFSSHRCVEVMYRLCSERLLSLGNRDLRTTFYKPTYRLFENMAWYEDLQCRDPRDRVYALLAISSDTAKLAITPDYSQNTSVNDLFRRVTVSTIRGVSDLVFLICACSWDNSSNPAHPSWAFNIPRPPHLAGTQGFNFGIRDRTPHPRKQLSSSLRAPLDVLKLTLRGRILDRISFSTPPIYWPRSRILEIEDSDCAKVLSQELQNTSQVLFTLGVTAENAAAVCRSIVADLNWSPPTRQNSSAVMDIAFYFWNFFRLSTLIYKNKFPDYGNKSKVLVKAYVLIDMMAAFLLEADVFDSFWPGGTMNEEEMTMGRDAIGRVLTRGRSLCITQQGNVANCLHEAKEGDVVAVFEGADLLFILHPVGDEYRLIGDAYVDGLMLGEAYEGVDPDEVDHDIVLI